ncbi:aminopeptidase N-like [Mytilus trossulus]|uniref:aminopeptidase N-like n=1 Tax=Mytilus trossulus TaxID=6551 RepID=UPI0030072614
MLERTELYGDFSAFMKRTFSRPLDRIGYSHTVSGHLETLLRSLVVKRACEYGDENCTNIAVSSFQNLMQTTVSNNPVDVDSRSSVYNTAIKYGGVNEWDFAYNRYKTHNVASERILMLRALSYSREVWVLSRFLQYTLTDDIRKQDGVDAMRLVGRNPIGRSLLWDFVRGNWKEITKRFGRVSHLVTDVTAKFNTEFDLQSLQTFKDSIPDLGSSSAAFDRAIETTQANIKWMDSNFQIIKDWLQSL